MAWKNSCHDDDWTRYVVRFFKYSGPIKIALDDAKYDVALHADLGSWCLQTRRSGIIRESLAPDGDESLPP